MISQYRTSLNSQNNYVENNYFSRTEPAFFIEPISQDDFATIFLHRHIKVIVWNHDSLDSMIQFGLLPKFLASSATSSTTKNTYHVSYTMSVSEKLEQYRLDHFHLPDFINQFIHSPTFNTNGNTKRDKKIIYLVPSDDIKMNQKIVDKFSHNLIFIVNKNASPPPSLIEKPNVKELYILNPEIDLPDSCFLSINLNSNISADIYKLGKRGINTINNEGTPYSLDYTDLNSIYKIIMDEMIEDNEKGLVDNRVGVSDSNAYNEIEFYQYPFEKYYQVCITYLAKDLYKIQNTSKFATPGIYTRHYLNLNQKYLIKIRGYKLFNTNVGGGGGDVCLWIAQENNRHKQTIMMDSRISLSGTYRESEVINYIFNNTISENNFYIGLLFQNAKDGDAFIFQSLQVIPLGN